ncbi:P-loop containing nucleoside triphosphate hydrolase protein [Thelephora terrestris]|uniref:P-loop containing nucleoside triphosphate hydrolase protein n=1 Tax=Thelephora terrestris TaxID=56493 RepID=A0A9P6HK12_9AGAM|nr:P-loop containing nucleoside triphosphate hydrolase protein [Thelephora terrestris]
MTNIVMGVRPERPTHPAFTDHLWALTQRCWEKDPEDRPWVGSIIEQLSTCEGPHSICTQPAAPQMCETPPSPSLGSTTFSFPFISLPQPPGYLYGRDNTLKDLLNLTERLAPVMLVGAGGTGKTAIALTLLCDYQIMNRFGNHRYFLRCDNLENSLDGFLGRLSEAIGVPKPADLAQLRSHLEVSPYMLVLDGVDSILDPRASGAAEIATAMEELGQCPRVCLLATSRIDAKIPGFRRKEVSTLSLGAARNIFHDCCSLERSVGIDTIIAELDFHPLSIVLLASAVSENLWDEPALLEVWNGGKTCILKASGRESLEDCIESLLHTPTIQRLGATARKTLEAIANYPDGVKETRLFTTFPEIGGVDDAVDALCKFSLMYREEGFVKMLSPFRLHFQYTGRVANLGVQPRRHSPDRLGDKNMAEGFSSRGDSSHG